MKSVQNIKLILVILLCAIGISNAQSIRKAEIGISGELLGGRTWGGVAGLAGEFNYFISNKFSVGGLYSYGSGFGGFGAVEHNPSFDDEVLNYNELSSFLYYNFDVPSLGVYIGTGIGLIWGDKQNKENYSLAQIPIVLGSKIQISDRFRISLKFIGNINMKTTFTGFGLGLIYTLPGS